MSLLVLLLACDGGEDAQGGISRAEFVEAVNGLQSELDAANARISDLESSLTQAEQLANANAEDLNGLIDDIAAAASAADLNTAGLSDLITRVSLIESDYLTSADGVALPADLTALDTYLSVDTTSGDITISGANLNINNGEGTTETVNGLGNLIVGYSELYGTESRTGSHNIVMGSYNDWFAYGSIVSGVYNTVDEHSVNLSGTANINTGPYSAMLGGYGNYNSGSHAVVISGYYNTASSTYSAVIGGYYNRAGGNYSVIAGGYNNSTSGNYSVTSGGFSNTSSGSGASILGGSYNRSTNSGSVVTGGYSNSATGYYSLMLGGYGLSCASNYIACID